MKNFFSTALLAAIFLASCHATPKPKTKFPEYLQTLQLQATDTRGRAVMSASGFAIDANRVVTAAHFCKPVEKYFTLGRLDDLQVVFVNGNELRLIEGAFVEFFDEEKDLCIVRADNHKLPSVKIGKTSSLKINDDILMIGGPLGIFPVSSSGKVVSTYSSGWGENYDARLIISANGTFGNSGGPVFNEQGEVIGIVIAGLVKFQYVMICATTEQLSEFLEEHAE